MYRTLINWLICLLFKGSPTSSDGESNEINYYVCLVHHGKIFFKIGDKPCSAEKNSSLSLTSIFLQLSHRIEDLSLLH